MRLIASSVFLVSYVLASEPVSPSPASEQMLRPAVLSAPTSSPQPPLPYLELRHLDLDRRQVQPAAVGAPAQAAAGALQQPNGGGAAPIAPVANPIAPVAQAPTTKPVTPVVAPTTAVTPAVVAPTALTATPAVPAATVATPAIPAAPAGGGIGGVPIASGPATAVEVAPPPKSGTIGLGTLTGQVGVVRTDEAKSEAGLAAGNKFGTIALWPSAYKVGTGLLLGTAVGIGILL
ncbi:MAG: hypothetical protein Q9169_001785 [Polycauliona sp. 2 TL-2023]